MLPAMGIKVTKVNMSDLEEVRGAVTDQTKLLYAERLEILHYAVSLGHHRSLIFYLPTQNLLESSFKLSSNQLNAYREFAGDGIFRVSVGIEDPDDLCYDLNQALSAL